MTDAVRLAVVASPRSGNTWLRLALARLYGLPHLAAHSLTDAEWATLPRECVVQIHWPWETRFADRLAREGFRVVTVARHPLDVLISILRFAVYEDTAPWLGGIGGGEGGLYGLTPRSDGFRAYASGPRAGALLGVSRGWWGKPGVIGLRFENLVADFPAEVGKVVAAVGRAPGWSFAEAAEDTRIERLRPNSPNRHFWQGRPGLWRAFLPPAEAVALAGAVAGPMATFEYRADPDPGLTPEQADANWVRYHGRELAEAVRTESIPGRAAQAENERLERVVSELEGRLQELDRRLTDVLRLGRFPLTVARVTRRVMDRCPGLVRAARQVSGRRPSDS